MFTETTIKLGEGRKLISNFLACTAPRHIVGN